MYYMFKNVTINMQEITKSEDLIQITHRSKKENQKHNK